MNKAMQISCCGVCCDHCGMHERISRIAKELKRFIQAYGYGDWIEHITQDFRFENFISGLSWFADSGCAGCLKGGGMPKCEIRNCCKEKGLENCYFCKDFSTCKKLDYQKETYRVNENYAKISRIGYGKWLEEQEEKLKKGFDNICFLEGK